MNDLDFKDGVHMRELVVILLLSSAVAGSACRQPAGEGQGNSQSNDAAAAWSVKIEPVNAPSGPNSHEPRLTASERGIILSWVERVGATAHLKFANAHLPAGANRRRLRLATTGS